LLPVDVVIARRSEDAENTRTVYVRGIPEDWRIVDIGPDTIDMIIRLTSGARLVIWNGPLGITEINPFARGTDTIAHVLSQLKNAITVVGGADSVSRISHLGLEEGFSHVSTGGGAFLEFMAGRTLPAIDALEEKD
jgi:phosphoglycerate kinase